MIASERVLYIMKSINELGVVNLKDIANQLGISETTVRRDFEKLEKQGKLKRVQGGATTNGGTEELLENAQLTTRLKTTVNMQQKQIVGAYAASLVTEGECIYLDDGTSILPIAEILMRKKVHIVTNSTLLLEKAKNATADVFLVGGQYQPYYDVVVGPIAQEILDKFHFDHAFIGCFGASLEKQMAYTMEMDCMSMKMLAMKNATQKHLLLDDSKLTKAGFYAIADLKTFDHIICNNAESIPQNLPKNFILV
ncbi:DeoR/GlpR family DNA-binding transcription regulator [Oscillospiraceae bacterium PP1C4]